MSDFKEALGRRIRQIRKEQNKTIEDIVAITGITNSALSKIERGAVSVSAENLFLISAALNVSSDFLLTGEQQPIGKQNLLSSDENNLLELFRKIPYKDQIKIIGYLEISIKDKPKID